MILNFPFVSYKYWWLALVILSCQEVPKNTMAPPNLSGLLPDSSIPEVAVQKVKRGRLLRKHYLNGRIVSPRRVDLRFEAAGKVVLITTNNGQYVSKDSIVAVVENRELTSKVRRSEVDLEQATMNRMERMIMLTGGGFEDTSITDQQLKYIDMASGFKLAKFNYETAKEELVKVTIKAPFDGIVSDTRVLEHQFVNEDEIMCTLIDTDYHEVEFWITQDYINYIDLGAKVSVSIRGRQIEHGADVVSINPVVSDHGLVRVRAKMRTKSTHWLEGMHVVVCILKNDSPSILVPKSALLFKAGRHVVFTYLKEEERSKWNYVTVQSENDVYIGISEGLRSGDLVIVEGQHLLDHNSQVFASSGVE